MCCRFSTKRSAYSTLSRLKDWRKNGTSINAPHSRTVGRCHLKTEAILWPSLTYYTGNNSSTTICSVKLYRIFSITSRLCMNYCITCLHSHGCDEKVARWGENVSSMFTFRNFVMAHYYNFAFVLLSRSAVLRKFKRLYLRSVVAYF